MNRGIAVGPEREYLCSWNTATINPLSRQGGDLVPTSPTRNHNVKLNLKKKIETLFTILILHMTVKQSLYGVNSTPTSIHCYRNIPLEFFHLLLQHGHGSLAGFN